MRLLIRALRHVAEPELRKVILRQERWVLAEIALCAASFSWGYEITFMGAICNLSKPAFLVIIFVFSALLSAAKVFRFRKSKGAGAAAISMLAPVPFFILNLYPFSANLGLMAHVKHLGGDKYLQPWADKLLSEPIAQLQATNPGYNQPGNSAVIPLGTLPPQIKNILFSGGMDEVPVTVFHPTDGRAYVEMFLYESRLGSMGLDVYSTNGNAASNDVEPNSGMDGYRSTQYYKWSPTMRAFFIY